MDGLKSRPVVPTNLPSDDCIWFEGQESDYPSPDDVRSRADQASPDSRCAYRPEPVSYPEKRLIVKWGTFVDITEGQCIWFLRNYFAGSVPVPRIYGWKRDGKQVFLYLELVKGMTLEERWPEMKPSERSAVCRELHSAIEALKSIQAPRDYNPLCGISGGPLRDIVFEDSRTDPARKYLKGDHNDTTGPHASVSAFHEALARRALRRPENFTNPRQEIEELSGFDDKAPIVFAHADLAKSNIILSEPGDGPCRLVAIIDWHQAGWYPGPWEYLKAYFVDVCSSEWVQVYLPKFLKEPSFPYLRSFDFVAMATI